MALTESRELPIGASAPDFSLRDTCSGNTVERGDFNGTPLLVVFMCNHCPFVVHLLDSLVSRCAEFQNQGVACVAISSNDINSYPQDGPERMAELAAKYGFGFPYLYDASQTVAREYTAVCTPEFFLFDDTHALYYHGQWDSSRPGSGSATGDDVAAAVTALVADEPAPTAVKPSMGCSIKWA